jgi:hypothetical protein
VTNERKHVSERLYDEHASDSRVNFMLYPNCIVSVSNSEIARAFVMSLEMPMSRLEKQGVACN